MKRSSKWAVTVIVTTLTLTGAATLSTSYAAASQLHQNTAHSMMKSSMNSMKVQVMKVYPVSATEIKLDAHPMELAHKTIVVTPKSHMGMTMSMMATYYAMKGTFVISGGKMLTPGISYTISASWAQIPMMDASFTIPDLVKVVQIAKNKIELEYDRAVDPMSVTAPKNYWIRSNQAMASGIANLGKNDMITAMNGLISSQVTITPADKSKMKFIMTFSANVTPGVMYTVIPCSVDANGAMGYMGPNFNSMRMNTFTGIQHLM